jgi:large subunit ribosomal protein L11
MAKAVKAKIKLQCPAGAATPAPPVGPALGQHGVNIGEFVKRFNDATKTQTGMVIPVIITVFEDRTFDMEYKSPPASVLLRKAAGVEKGAGNPKKDKVGKVTRAQIREICQVKKKELNGASEAANMLIVEGTARSMGITVID